MKKVARGRPVFKPRGSSTANVSVFCILVCYLCILQATRVVNVDERGGVKVRIPGRDSSVSSVSLWCYFFVCISYLLGM